MDRYRKSVRPNHLPEKKCPELLSLRKAKEVRKWFKENIPSEITDVSGRKIKIDAEKFGHLTTFEAKKGKRKFSQQRARQLNLIRPCIEYPLAIYSRRDEYMYGSPWKPVPGKRFIVVCMRSKGGELKLTTAFCVVESKVLERVRTWKERNFRV